MLFYNSDCLRFLYFASFSILSRLRIEISKKMASNSPNIQEMEKWTKAQLSEFLKSRGKQGFSAFNRPRLLEYAIQVAQEEEMVIDDSVLDSLIESRKIFDAPNLKWLSYEVLKASDIPTNFDIHTISDFLTNVSIDFGDEKIETGIVRPAKKGRQFYTSKKTHLIEVCLQDTTLLFRGTIEASMKNQFRLVGRPDLISEIGCYPIVFYVKLPLEYIKSTEKIIHFK